MDEDWTICWGALGTGLVGVRLQSKAHHETSATIRLMFFKNERNPTFRIRILSLASQPCHGSRGLSFVLGNIAIVSRTSTSEACKKSATGTGLLMFAPSLVHPYLLCHDAAFVSVVQAAPKKEVREVPEAPQAQEPPPVEAPSAEPSSVKAASVEAPVEAVSVEAPPVEAPPQEAPQREESEGSKPQEPPAEPAEAPAEAPVKEVPAQEVPAQLQEAPASAQEAPASAAASVAGASCLF